MLDKEKRGCLIIKADVSQFEFWIEYLLPFLAQFPFVAMFNCSNRKAFWSINQCLQMICICKVGVIKYRVVGCGGFQQFLDMAGEK